jgi:hypothetical protein
MRKSVPEQQGKMKKRKAKPAIDASGDKSIDRGGRGWTSIPENWKTRKGLEEAYL